MKPKAIKPVPVIMNGRGIICPDTEIDEEERQRESDNPRKANAFYLRLGVIVSGR